MPDTPTVDVPIPVDPATAELLADPRRRAAVGMALNRALRPEAGAEALSRLIASIKTDARAAGLTDAEVDAELAAHKAERRSAP